MEVRVPGLWSKCHGFEERWDNFLLQGRLSVLTYFTIHFTPMLAQQHVKEPAHSPKSAGYSWTHAPQRVTLHEETVNWCMIVWCAQNVHWDGSSLTWYQPCKTTKQRCKNCRSEPHVAECSEPAPEQRIALYKNDQQQVSVSQWPLGRVKKSKEGKKKKGLVLWLNKKGRRTWIMTQ